jgi:hypothetical protein
VVISATKKVRAYEPETGKLIWECAGLGLNVIPHPVQHNDTALVMSGHMFVDSPAVAEGELFLRSKTHLFCVSDGKTK